MTDTYGHNSGDEKVKVSQLDEVSICGGDVLLYRRPNNLVWQYRYRVSKQKKYIRKSTGSKNLEEAKRIAHQEYNRIIARIEENIPVFSITYGKLLDDVFKKWKLDNERRLLSDGRLKDLQSAADLYYRRYFDKYQITSITQGVIDQFWDYRYHFWAQPEHQKLKRELGINRVSTNPSKKTLEMEKPLLDRVLELAVTQGYILPHKVPKTVILVKKEEVKRPAFTEKQIHIIRSWLPVFASTAGHGEASTYRRKMLEPYVNVLLFTGMRVGAIRTVRWRDVEQFSDQDMLRFTVQGKPKKGQKIRKYCPACPYSIWTQYLEPWKKISKHTNSDDYVFADTDGKPCTRMDYQFAAFQKFVEQATAASDDYVSISCDTFGEELPLYSLRHSFATFQRRYFNRDWEVLASQMGTSSDMLRSNYVNIEPLEYSQEFAGTNGKTDHTAIELSQEKLAALKILMGG